jgi:acetylornithine deacetylase
MSKLSQAAVDRILAAVDRTFDDQIALLSDLVSTPTQRGAERAGQERIATELEQRGYAVDRFSVPLSEIGRHPAFSPATIDYSDTFNVVGSWHPETIAGRSLALNAHIDVVPTADPALWRHPPYSADQEDGWLYGRGAGDMKAGLVANIFAIDAVRAAGLEFTAPVQIQSVIDEETTGNGTAAAIARGYVADAIVIPEPTDERLVRANTGVIKFAIKVRGVPAHPRNASSGVSALDAMIVLISHLKALESGWNAERSAHPLFAGLDNPVALNLGTIRGGEWPASVPCTCRIEGRIGFYPGDDAAARAREFEAFVAVAKRSDDRLKAAMPQVEWVGVMQPGYVLDGNSAAEETFRAACVAAGNGDPAAYVMPCYLDAALFAVHAGRPAIVYGPLAESIHAIDERVSLDSIRRVTGTLALFAATWCGVRERSG